VDEAAVGHPDRDPGEEVRRTLALLGGELLELLVDVGLELEANVVCHRILSLLGHVSLIIRASVLLA